jgi:hypothetical protein
MRLPPARRARALAALLAVAAVVLPGCLGPRDGSAFGPLAGDDGEAAGEGGHWPVSLKAKPARGPVPLVVHVELRVQGAPADLPWRAEFGDGSSPRVGLGPEAVFNHTFEKVGDHRVVVGVGAGREETLSTLTIVALEPGTPVEDPDEEVEGTPVPDEDSDDDGSDGEDGDGEDGDGDDDPFGSGSSSSGPTSGATSGSPATSATSSPAPAPASSSASSTSRAPTTSPSPSAGPSPSPSPSPSPAPSSTTSTSRPPSTTSTSSAPSNQMPEASLTPDRWSAQAPADITYTVSVRDPDGGPISWTFSVEGVEKGSGTTAVSSWTSTQRYSEAGSYTAVLTATDGVYTVRREVTVTIHSGPI